MTETKKGICVALDVDVVNKIEKISEKYKQSRSYVVNDLLRSTLVATNVK